MKATPYLVDGVFPVYRPGTIIGKALSALPPGQGVIEAFVFLR